MKILIIRRDNIGDLICTTPLFEAIRRQYPGAYIAALVNSYNAPAIMGNPYLNDIFAYTKGKHADGESVLAAYWRRLGLMWRLRRMRFDYVLLPANGFAGRALKLARWLAPRQIVGFAPDGRLDESGLDLAISHDGSAKLHETEDIFRLLAPLGISSNIPSMTVVPAPNVVSALQGSLPAVVRSGEGPLIALHISARKEKQRWSVEHFVALAGLLHSRHRARFLIFWSPGDENNPFHPGDDRKAERLLAALTGLPVAPMRTEHLAELIAGLSLCDVAVLSDGGAMHVAAGLGKPIVCFFGNSALHRWYPWGVSYIALQKDSCVVDDVSPEEAAAAFTEIWSATLSNCC